MTEKSAKTFFATIGVIACIIGVVGLVGCDKRVREYDIGWDINYGVRVIDGCQYIVCQGNIDGITHKGNCTNSIHIYRMDNSK